MLLGAIADDFTGASDLANTLAKGGMATSLFVGPGGDPGASEAGVVALKTRMLPVAEAVRQSLAAAEWLLAQGCEQLVFKYCSTFDSTPKGNIGPVAEALLDLMKTDIAIVCPAFPETGRRVFMGHLFVGDRLLNESGMENHPLTPMTDADLRRFLRLQTRGSIGHVSFDSVRAGLAAVAEALEAERQAGNRLVVTDAVTDEDLVIIGKAVAGHKLITGGSGIALGLPGNFRERGLLAGEVAAGQAARGRGTVLCGSCSLTSQRQVAHYRRDHPGFAVDPADLMEGRIDAESVAIWVKACGNEAPIVYSSADAEAVARVQAAFGREAVAARIEAFFGALAAGLVDDGFRRIVAGGGETSGAVVEALGLCHLRIGPEIDPGVPVLFAERRETLGLALKSGNFGATDFFSKALQKAGKP